MMTPEQRHRCMSRIKGRDTKPELVVRRWLWHQGFRYRLYVKSLPGRPDIVMRKWKTAIFVNGCFWHGHDCNKRKPSTNAQFWQDKINRNRERDASNQAKLQAAGVPVDAQTTSCHTARTGPGPEPHRAQQSPQDPTLSSSRRRKRTATGGRITHTVCRHPKGKKKNTRKRLKIIK